MSVWTVL
jgi:hypothetical protein